MDRRLSREELLAADPDDLTEWEQAWRVYFERNPNVLATWGHQNGRLPNDTEES